MSADERRENDSSPSSPPLSQKQEDLLLELFLQLRTEDRIKVIKLTRDLVKASADGTSEA